MEKRTFFFLSETNRELKDYHLMWDNRLYLASLYMYLFIFCYIFMYI